LRGALSAKRCCLQQIALITPATRNEDLDEEIASLRKLLHAQFCKLLLGILFDLWGLGEF
jgi:hypothetical protein